MKLIFKDFNKYLSTVSYYPHFVVVPKDSKGVPVLLEKGDIVEIIFHISNLL